MNRAHRDVLDSPPPRVRVCQFIVRQRAEGGELLVGVRVLVVVVREEVRIFRNLTEDELVPALRVARSQLRAVHRRRIRVSERVIVILVLHVRSLIAKRVLDLYPRAVRLSAQPVRIMSVRRECIDPTVARALAVHFRVVIGHSGAFQLKIRMAFVHAVVAAIFYDSR